MNRLTRLLAGMLCSLLPLLANAQTCPDRPIRLIVPFPAGGPADSIARHLGKSIAESLKQPVAVENRAGAGGVIGLDMVAKAKPDGYTLGIGSISNLGINVSLMEKLPYDARKDFTPISNGGMTTGIILAHASVPFSDFAGMIAYAKANPQKLAYATAGIGSVGHMVGLALEQETGAKMIHIAYKGTGPAAQDLLAGAVPLFIETSLTTAIQHMGSGRIKLIAVTRKNRSPLLPSVAGMGELGFSSIDSPAWFGLVGPANMPPAVLASLNEAVIAGLKKPETASLFAQFGAEPAPTTPLEFGSYIQQEIQRWSKIIKAANLTPQ
jgi:tripartite-type tricarboxylate transporter receptor subunit TctC